MIPSNRVLIIVLSLMIFLSVPLICMPTNEAPVMKLLLIVLLFDVIRKPELTEFSIVNN